MPYLNCPRCGLTIKLRASFLAIEHCPRCRARAKLLSPLYVTRLPARLDPDREIKRQRDHLER
jgi:hypothetical protein